MMFPHSKDHSVWREESSGGADEAELVPFDIDQPATIEEQAVRNLASRHRSA